MYMADERLEETQALIDRELAAAALAEVEPLPLDVYDDEPVTHKGNGSTRANGTYVKVAPTDEPKLILRPIHEIVAEQREPEWLLYRILEARVLAVLVGPRETFKSFIALDWMMRIALDGHGVVILSGEGAGLDRRVDAWMRTYAPDTDIKSLPIVVLEKPVSLNNVMVLAAAKAAIKALPWKPVAVMVDTVSKFAPGMKENDNTEVAAFLTALSMELRDELGCTVLLVAHTGHTDETRARGAYTLTANPDCEYVVNRPNKKGMSVSVTRSRFKDTAALPPLGYEARVIDLGRSDSHGDRVTSLVLASTEAPAPEAKNATGRNQIKALTALKEWARANPEEPLITSIDLLALLKAQRLDRKRAREVIEYLTRVKILTASVGGYTMDRLLL
jgi:hypothetical protein